MNTFVHKLGVSIATLKSRNVQDYDIIFCKGSHNGKRHGVICAVII